MSDKVTEHATPSEPRSPRCQGCWEIKRKRAQALADGDRQTVMKMIEAMGVHIWEAHA
ncbi:hypothetical protein [Streptomyces olivoreticuli]|uniref:hypothetical protein n=1 Tax=Streptomyces olivoreticuli TaxID=68246 RepID=UPI0013C31F0B|nr:hypothetical protein [Streptomyces olivoreticuli]